MFCAVDVKLMDVNLHTKKKNTEALLDAGKEGGLYYSELWEFVQVCSTKCKQNNNKGINSGFF